MLALLALAAAQLGTPIDPPSKPGSQVPSLAVDGRVVVLVWIEPDGTERALRLAQQLLSGRRARPLLLSVLRYAPDRSAMTVRNRPSSVRRGGTRFHGRRRPSRSSR